MQLAAPPPAPVSYEREIAPLFAMRCHSCHGDAGGLSTRSYRELMAGGNKGKVILPGEGGGSLLVQFVDGRRGEAHRMPLGGKPLAASQIELIGRWIDQGARDDDAILPHYTRTLGNVSWPVGRRLTVSFVVPTEAYVSLRIRDGHGRVLAERVGPVKKEREEPDLGTVDARLSFDFQRGADWPRSVNVELRLEYAAGDPGDAGLRADTNVP